MKGNTINQSLVAQRHNFKGLVTRDCLPECFIKHFAVLTELFYTTAKLAKRTGVGHLNRSLQIVSKHFKLATVFSSSPIDSTLSYNMCKSIITIFLQKR